jgi:Rps23 Pro-64 3,4-dihydroxylase Tpa1-like proline 4-hydroxylase
MNPLQHWLSPEYLKAGHIETLRAQYAKNKPFAHLRLANFFQPAQLEFVRAALLKERFVEAEADLFTFEQTNDLKLAQNKTLKDFRAFLRSPQFLTFLSYITGENLSREIDISGFVYDDTDHLLPHDDKLEGRKIAFVVNLSKNWTAKDGGQLDFFKGNKIAKSYVPEWNSFVIFTVKPGTTLHQVREVVTDKKRLTLAGWFHG